jgi:integrase
MWSFSAGSRGSTVTVYERERGGVLYARAFDPSLRKGRGDYRRVSLGYRNRARAEQYAVEQAARLASGQAEITSGRITLARLLALYHQHRTPRKTEGEQLDDARRIEMWTRVLGARKDPHKITLGEWETFIDVRGSGAIDSRGVRVDREDERRPVSTRRVEADLKWLRWVLNWGAKWRDREGRYLLPENAVRGYEIPVEKNPRRPVATQDRYEALRAVSDDVSMEVRWDSGREKRRSYLSELLDIVSGTGRRISAVLQLRYHDLRLDVEPHGAIRWPADTDKERKEWLVPISPSVRATLDRVLLDRPGIGAAFLFPSPTDRTQPVTYERVRTWLYKAEKLAGLPKQQGSLWHAFRRKWATERKHMSPADVARAGGWSTTVTLQRCYQQPDEETMLRVVLGAGELRAKQA